MLSDVEYRLIDRILKSKRSLPEDQVPTWASRSVIDSLVDNGFLAVGTLCPPGKESRYPVGLVGYYVTPDGLDAFRKYTV